MERNNICGDSEEEEEAGKIQPAVFVATNKTASEYKVFLKAYSH